MMIEIGDTLIAVSTMRCHRRSMNKTSFAKSWLIYADNIAILVSYKLFFILYTLFLIVLFPIYTPWCACGRAALGILLFFLARRCFFSIFFCHIVFTSSLQLPSLPFSFLSLLLKPFWITMTHQDTRISECAHHEVVKRQIREQDYSNQQ